MPVTTPRPSKRKHADGEPSTGKKTKEERRAEKRAKRDGESTPTQSPNPKSKSKTKSQSEQPVAVPTTPETEFKLVRARTSISLPPRFAGDPRRGVEEILDNLVMRYVPSLRGVLLSHKNHKFASDVAIMYAEGPYPTTRVEFDAGVWAPEVGMRITGRISLHATDHIGLLVHRTFNASIDRAHIPGDGEWEYVHGPVANDPEINNEERQGDEESGRWVNSQTGETLGGESGLVEFTVIGYTIANQMLSLHGSLQPDPFDPEYYTNRQTTARLPEPTQTEGDRIEEGSDDEVEVEEEELAAPRGTKRRVVNVLSAAPKPTETESAPVKKKQKKGAVKGEASVAVLEAAANTAEQEDKKKRKKKKAVPENGTTMAAGAVKPAVSYAAVVAKGTSASSHHDPDSPSHGSPERTSPKGKARDSRVNFADSPAPNERTALLRQQRSPSSGSHGSDEEQGDAYEEAEDRGFVTRAKRALGFGKGENDTLPLYAEDGRTQRRIRLSSGLGALLGLIIIAILIAGALLVRSGDHATGPSPSPPTPAYPMPSGGTSGPRNPAYLIKAEHGAVASEARVCSQIGVDVLKDGGNAIDAAIASNLCVGTVNPFSAGIGGGGFMVIRIPPSSPEKSSTVHTIDFRETAPAGSNSSMFAKSPLLSKFGGLSVAVPGEIRGLQAAHSQFGRLPWSRLFEPSIQLANGGWEVTAELDRRIRVFGKGWMENDKDWSPVFAPGGTLLKQGDWIKRENFSYTLSSIASEGADAFYKGPIASSLISKVQATGGIMTLEDLESYKVVEKPALKSTYQGRHIYTTHAPSSGPVLIHVLNALERFGSGPNVHDQVAMQKEGGLWWHRVIEALKFGSAARTRLGDPAFGNNHKLMAEIPTKEFGNNVSSRITDDTTHTPDYYNPVYDVQIDHGTTHTSAADADGFAIALTSSVNLIWGSRVMDPATGVIFNDVMDDFSTPGYEFTRLPNAFGLWPSPWNYPEAGKRQVSSMAPTIMEYPSGDFYLTLGGSGGSRIFGAIAQAIVNLDRGMNISGAVEAPRVHDQLFPTLVSIESGFGHKEIDALKQRGHNTSVFDINLGVAEIQAVTQDMDGQFFAASDSRKNGVAAGW
ncbi:Gamma-glutamyltranspeptidase, partial [Rhizoctonia solani]